MAFERIFLVMEKKPKSSARKTGRRAKTGAGAAVYRGVLLHRPNGKSTFSKNQIRRAIDAAIEKNADALAEIG